MQQSDILFPEKISTMYLELLAQHIQYEPKEVERAINLKYYIQSYTWINLKVLFVVDDVLSIVKSIFILHERIYHKKKNKDIIL